MAAAVIRVLTDADEPEWLRMRLTFWPEGTAEEHLADMKQWRARDDAVVLVAAREGSTSLGGFAEVGTRSHADGCDTSPVGYLEGWFVDADLRRTGVGRALVRAAEGWVRARGLREFASDVLLDNDVSHRAHRALGFEEVDRQVTYRKDLS